MQKRNATCAVIGAGDYIGAEIAKKFAAEGFAVFAGRRNGEKLEPLVKEVEAAGGTIFGRSLDARKEEEIAAFLNDADGHSPLDVCIFNVGANVNFMLQFNLLEPRPVFTDYAARMTDRDAFRRARDIDGKLIAEMQAQQAAAQPA